MSVHNAISGKRFITFGPNFRWWSSYCRRRFVAPWRAPNKSKFGEKATFAYSLQFSNFWRPVPKRDFSRWTSSSGRQTTAGRSSRPPAPSVLPERAVSPALVRRGMSRSCERSERVVIPKGARRAPKCSGGPAGRFEGRPKAAVASKNHPSRI